jgi:hypothetical protein
MAEAAALLSRPSPVTINPDLTEEEATFGQFELICCDAISAVIRSEVALGADREYLKDLLQRISHSPEFKATTVRIDDVPVTESGERFTYQFLGLELKQLTELGFPRRFTMPAKKARIMKHWATRVGANLHDNEAQPGAAPSGVPSASIGDTGDWDGPPSVS